MIVKRRYLDFALAGLLLLLPALILRSSLRDPSKLSGFDNAVLRISSPLQTAVSWVVEGIGGVVNRYLVLVDVEEENDELRALNRELQEEIVVLRGQQREVDSLTALLQLKHDTAAESAAASVIAASVNSQFRITRIRIDQGADRVTIGMPVIAGDGLVGRVQRVFGDYSDVRLVSDAGSSIDVVIPKTGGKGVLHGLARDDSYECEIEYLERGKEVSVGDEVVTSGLGKHFPEGLVVGTISSVDTVQQGLYQKVTVKPAVDINRLDKVLVLLAPPPPSDPNRKVNRRSDSAYGIEPF